MHLLILTSLHHARHPGDGSPKAKKPKLDSNNDHAQQSGDGEGGDGSDDADGGQGRGQGQGDQQHQGGPSGADAPGFGGA